MLAHPTNDGLESRGGRQPEEADVRTRPIGSALAGCRRHAAFALVLGVLAALALDQIVFVLRNASPMPFADDSTFVRIWFWGSSFDPNWLWMPHNEHRLPLPRVFFAALYALRHDMRMLILAQVALASFMAFVCVLVARRLRGRSSWIDLVFPLVWLSPGNSENLLMGFQLSLALPTALSCVVPLTLCSSPLGSSPRAAAGCALSLVALPLCGGSGLGYWPSLLVACIAVGFMAQRSPVRAARRGGAILFAGAALSAAIVVFYLIGLPSPPGSHTRDIVRALSVAMRFLTLVFGHAGEVWWPASAWIVVVVIVAASAVLVRAWREKPLERLRVLGLALGIPSVLTLALLIGFGRGAQGEGAGFALRYVGLPAPLFALCALAFVAYAPRIISTVILGSFVCTLIAAGISVERPATQELGLLRREEYRAIHAAIRSPGGSGEMFRAQARSSLFRLKDFASAMSVLAEHGLPPFESLDLELRRPWIESADLLNTLLFPRAHWEGNREFPREHWMEEAQSLVLCIPTPSALFVPIPDASTRVHVRFGILPGFYEDMRGTGAHVVIVLVARPTLRRVVYERDLDPRPRSEDRGVQELELELPRDVPEIRAGRAELVLRLLVRRDGARKPAWVYVAPVVFSP